MTNEVHLHHVAVIVTNVEKSAAFYQAVFGFKPKPRLTQKISSHRGAWFQLGEQEFHLQERVELVTKTEQHFALIAKNFEEILEKTRCHGGKVEEAKLVDGFTKRAFLYDLDDNRIELLAT